MRAQSILSLLAVLNFTAAWSCPADSSALQDSETSCRLQLWDVPAPDLQNNLTLGYGPISPLKRIQFYNGVAANRTYSHHPLLLSLGETVVLVHSSAKQDEDSMGQEIWGGVSHDGGMTWTESTVILPSALLPNQTQEYNFTYWCNQSIPQRAWGPVSVVQSPVSQLVYAVADSSDFFCNAGMLAGSYTRGAGRIARPMDLQTGGPGGDPCWLYTNEFTYGPLEFDKTIYGTEWEMKMCDEVDVLNQVLGYPAEVPAWSAVLYNNKFYAVDDQHDLQEVTHSVFDQSSYTWQRFWRDISGQNNSQSVWTECTCNSTVWYPNNVPLEGNEVSETNASHPIYETDIPDTNSKQYFGTLSTPANHKVRYLMSNPRRNSGGIRQPLTIAWQGLNDTDDNWTFKSIQVLATNASSEIAIDSRGYKNIGFSYPSGVQSGDSMVLAYSENKQNIWVSVVPISSL